MLKAAEVDIETLKHYPTNPRKGNVEALAESLRVNGQYRPIVVQQSTDYILAGNHLWDAAKSLGWKKISVVRLDVDDEQARKIVAADNRLADLGTYDDEALAELLEGLDLEGTGYTPMDLDDLVALIDERTPLGDPQSDEQPTYEGVRDRQTLTEKAERYAERTVRLLMAEYPNHIFIWMQERLAEICEDHGLDSNADALIKAVEHITETQAPK